MLLRKFLATSVPLFAVMVGTSAGFGEDGVPIPADTLIPPTDALTAGQQAHQEHELRRQAAVARQIGLNDEFRRLSVLPPVGYGYIPYRHAPSLDYLYANPANQSLWPHSRYYSGPLLFEPWPYVQGDIWSYRPPSYVRQPIGQQQIQTGPNRWESYPIYAEDAVAQPSPVPGQLPPVPDAKSAVPPANGKQAPREF